MALFLSKKAPIFVSFPENTDESVSETPFWEVQRTEALEILTYIFETWNASWENTKHALGDLNLSESGLRRLNFYENEQKKEIISLLAKILVCFERGDDFSFSNHLISLAKELRPSLPYVEYDPEENFSLTPYQLAQLRNFMQSEAISLKSSVSELQSLARKRILSENILTESNAEQLIREKLGLTYFDFVEFKEEPEFSDGYYPELLQESIDFGF